MPDIEPLDPDDPPSIGPYRLTGRLGAGGQGVVYLGEDAGGNRVAVKVLREEVAAEPRARERFLKEVAAARRVDPFCIAQVLDASAEGRRPYIVTEYVEGPSLQQDGPRGGAALQRLAVATATALAAVHEAGVVHRDFKPSNVLLGPDGPRVIDFGIARQAEAPLTMTSSIIGTPAYMAPEQFAGEEVGAPADVFAWGSVIVFAAGRRPPFGADTFPAIMHRVLSGEPDLGDLPEPLRSTVAACLAKDPAARPTMQAVLLRLLGSRQSGSPLPGATDPRSAHAAPPPSGPDAAAPPTRPDRRPPMPGAPPPEPDGRRRRLVLLAGGGSAAVVAALVLAASLWWSLGTDGTESGSGGGAPVNPAAAGRQEIAGEGSTGRSGTKPSADPSASPSASTTGSPSRGESGRPGASGSPGTGGRPGSGGTDDGGGTGGGGTGGGGGGTEPTAPSDPAAAISYFEVGEPGTCYSPGEDFPFRYKIDARGDTPIRFSIYFDGRLGEGHPVDWSGDFAQNSFQMEQSKGTYTYRLVLLRPVQQERTQSVKIC